ncbi:hypothetical protein ACE1OC_41275 [Streptomyces sp. DSM 116496]|uniref:hypothetical protein n=1 Tax=Streptomyces stoeckheimensis TaxID=3344656 RepID=UPI0038B38E22
MALLTTMAAAAGAAHADTVDPKGVGGLLPAPSAPRGGGTMYETYPDLLTWTLDKDFGDYDFLDPALHMVADVLMVILVTIGSAVSTLAGWTFGMADLPEVQGPLTQAISGSASAVMVGLFPSALAVGGLVGFLRSQRGDGNGISELAWVLVSAVAAATLLTSPQTWVDGVDEGRMFGTEIAMSATDAGIGAGGGIEKMPLALAHPTSYPGDAADRVSRRASDTVWRVYTALPWCLAEFGSVELCQKHGRAILDFGPDKEKRKQYLQEHVDKNVGAESKSWREGHRPLERAGVLVVAVPVALLFGVLMIVLLFGSIAAMMAALFLLVVGPLFACLWVIPGRPRQWGVRWVDALVGTVMQAAITTLAAGAVMIIQLVTALAMPTYGWLGCSALSIAGAVSAFRYRAILTGIIGGGPATGRGGAGALLGALATRSVSRQAGRLLGTPRRISRRIGDAVERRHQPQQRPRPAAPPPPPRPPGGGRPARPGPGNGPGRGPGPAGTGPGGTGPGPTLAAANRRTNRTPRSTPTGTQPTGPGQGGGATPARRLSTPSGNASPPSPTSGTIPAQTGQAQPASAASAASTTARTVRPRPQGAARRPTQPPAPSAAPRRTPRPQPPVIRAPRLAPPPTGWTQPPLPDPPPAP